MGRWLQWNDPARHASPPAALSSWAPTLSHARLVRWGMLGVMLVGAALRLMALDRVPPGLSHDEAYNGITALEVWLLGRREIFFDIYNGIEPLIIYWEALYLRLFGITPLAMRLVNVTAGLLTIPLSFAFTRRLLTHLGPRSARWIALLTALGLSLSFWAVFVSRLTLRAVTLPLLELPALFCLWQGLVGAQEGQLARHTRCFWRLYPATSTERLVYFAAGGTWLGAAMYTYLSSRFLPLVPLLFFGYWLLRGQMRREQWLGMALFFAAWALAFTPLALYYLEHPDVFGRRAGQVLNLPLALAGDPLPLIRDTWRTLGMFGLVGPDSSRYGLAGRPVFEPVGYVFFLCGLIVALTRLRRPAGQAASYALLLIWWLVMLIPGFITGESPHWLRTIGALPPTCIFWALGIVSLGTKLVPRLPASLQRMALPALVLYLAVSGWFTLRDYFGRWASDGEARAIYGADFTEIAGYLEKAELKGPVAISAAYYRDWDRFRLDLLMHHDPPFAVWFDGSQTFLFPPPGTKLEPIYIFPRSAPPHPRWLDFLQLETQGSEMAVYRLQPEARGNFDAGLTAIATDEPSQAAQLLGYQLEGKAQAGETLRLLLHWQALLDVAGDPDYAFFAHVRDRRGYTWAQADANGYAVVDWQPGVQVLQWLELPLPPDLAPLEYSLVVGLEERGTSQLVIAPVKLDTLNPTVAAAPPLPEEFLVPNPGEVTVGGLFTLRGYSLDPRFLQPAGSTHVTLFWQTRAAPGGDYTLALWLVDPSGARFELGERQPLDGDYPTHRWGAGQWVRDRFDLTLPPNLAGGLYQVFAGWRDPGGTWLTAGDQVGIPLGEIFIPNAVGSTSPLRKDAGS